MKIFISWSKEPSKSVAAALHEWLPLLADDITPWMSDKDIGSGQRGLVEIEESLVDAGFGIVVITKLNAANTWINFEAGALSKATKDTELRVVPLLVDYQKETDLQGPIAQMQCELLTRDGVLELVRSIATVLDRPKILDRFDHVWPAFEAMLEEIDLSSSDAPTEVEERDLRDITSEILTHVRELRRDAAPQPVRVADGVATWRRANGETASEKRAKRDFITEVDRRIREFAPAIPGLRFEVERPGRITLVIPGEIGDAPDPEAQVAGLIRYLEPVAQVTGIIGGRAMDFDRLTELSAQLTPAANQAAAKWRETTSLREQP